MIDVEPLVRAGLSIHWLVPRTKKPFAAWDVAPIQTIADLHASYEEGMNVGVRLGKWSVVCGLYLHVIDLDIRDSAGSVIAEAKANLRSLFPGVNFGLLPTVRSGSGGASRHYYLLCERAFASKKLAHSATEIIGPDKKKHWTWEIELYGTGKQVVLPPSIHPDTRKPYVWLLPFDFRLVKLGLGPEIPAQLLENLSRESAEDGFEIPEKLGMSLAEARKILEDLPESQYREDREGWLQVGMALHHEFGGATEAFDLWCEFSKPSDKFDKRDQVRVWKSFKPKPRMLRMATLRGAARETRIMRAFEEMADDEPERTPEIGLYDHLLDTTPRKPTRAEIKLRKESVEIDLGRPVPPKVAWLNERHAIARMAGKTVILDFKDDGVVNYGNVTDLNTYYANNRVAKEDTTEPISAAWLRHKQRRQYPNGIIFAPGRDVPGAFNHWQGFAVEPSSLGTCGRLLRHIRRILCNDDDTQFRYLIGWLAHMVQRPEEKPGVAVVIKGKKGVGKDVVGDYIGGLFPHHHVKIANQEQLTGKFNAHQEKCLMLHVEEGFWAGNKQAESTLKHLITSEEILIEPKGLNAFQMPSVLRLFMTSNENWIVPATADERRYFVLNASPAKRGDREYFNRLFHEMKNGGRAVLLRFLLDYDLTGFDIRNVPQTAALGEQKLRGLRNFESWWYSILQHGRMDFVTNQDAWLNETIVVDRDEFRTAYSRWLKGRRFDGDELRDFEIGRLFKTLLPSLEARQKRNGVHMERIYRFPALDICRQEFEQFLGSEIIWDSQPPDEISPDDDDF